MPGEHLKQDDAQGVDVAATIDGLVAMHLLRTHVSRRADNAAPRKGGRGLGNLDNAEVGQEGVAIVVEENVAGLEVAVDNASLVGMVQRRADAIQDMSCLGDGKRPFLQPVGQGAATHVAHHQIWLPVIFAEVIYWHDGGVFQCGNGPGFALKPAAEGGVVQEFAGQHFDGHIAPKHGVVGQENGSHSPFADSRFYDVTSDILRFHGFLSRMNWQFWLLVWC